MILYKYYGFNSGISALKSRNLGFRQPAFFNDPFEFTCFSHLQTETALKLFKDIKESVGVLSLTRNPLNELMWSHYGEEHRGFVIGYEVDDSFLTSTEFNLIPLQEGDVVYTNTKTPQPISEENIAEIWFDSVGEPPTPEREAWHRIWLKKMFLTKHAAWSYEEEVRVVKKLDSIFQETHVFQEQAFNQCYVPSRLIAPDCSEIMVNGLHIYRHELKIREVYLGVRNPLLEQSYTFLDGSVSQLASDNSWLIYGCKPKAETWNLDRVQVESSVLKSRNQGNDVTIDLTIRGKEFKTLIAALHSHEINDSDSIKVTNFMGEIYISKNGNFIN